MYQVFCCYHLQSSNNPTYKRKKDAFYFLRADKFLEIALTAKRTEEPFMFSALN